MSYTTREKAEIMAMPCKGYWSTFGGVEVKDIQYGIEDYVVCVANAWYGGKDNKTVHRLMVKYTNLKKTEPRAYVTLFGQKLYLDECLRA